MSMSKNIARLAVTAGLTAALSFGGVMAPVTMAFAADANGSVTITNVTGNVTEFKGYQIFKADVAADGTASNITWANTMVRDAVEGVIKEEDTPYTGTTAQDAADWITNKMKGTDNTTRVAFDSVAYKIADAVKGLTTSKMTSNQSVSGLEHGYWLFVTDDATIDNGETGTSPIFTVVGKTSVEITEKTSIPEVDKKILNDGKNKTAETAVDNDWDIVGDSQIGQEVDYKLTGTVADNIASYATYEYEFQDTLSKGLVVTKGEGSTPKDLHVYIVNGKSKIEVKSGFKATVTQTNDTQNSEILKVSFGDLKAVKDGNDTAITVDKDSKVVVTYKAKLTSDASYEVAGNPNTVKLVYSNNPMGEGTGTSVQKTVTDHVFRLDVTKVDQIDTNKKLVAGFKVKVVENEDGASVGKWLSEDGSLVNDEASAHEFITVESTGEVMIPGLDAGKYEITETTTPESYNTIAPFTITVTPKYDEQGNLEKLTVTDSSDMVETNATNSATIPVTVKNKKGSGLPLTGLNGVTFTWIAGGAVLCIGVAHLIRSRKQAEESEQE